MLAFLPAIPLIDIPYMLGVMLTEGRKLNGRFRLQGIALYREKVPWKTFAQMYIGGFVVAYILVMHRDRRSSS